MALYQPTIWHDLVGIQMQDDSLTLDEKAPVSSEMPSPEPSAEDKKESPPGNTEIKESPLYPKR